VSTKNCNSSIKNSLTRINPPTIHYPASIRSMSFSILHFLRAKITQKRHAFFLGSILTLFAYRSLLKASARRQIDEQKRRSKRRLTNFVERVPKIELHAHLSGSIRESTLRELAAAKNILTPELERILINNNRDLSACFAVFDLIHNCITDEEALRRVIWETLDDFKSRGVCYLELRTTPRPLPDDGTTLEGYVNVVLDCMER